MKRRLPICASKTLADGARACCTAAYLGFFKVFSTIPDAIAATAKYEMVNIEYIF